MIDPSWADPLRLINAVGSVAWLFTSMYAVVVSHHLDARIRHGFGALIGFVLAYGHLSSLGRPAAWPLLVLVVIVPAMIWSTVVYVRRELGERRRGR